MSELHPPIAKILPARLENHGDVRVDDYYWLRDRNDPDTLAYLEAENQYAQAVMLPTEPLQTQLYEEMLSHIQEDDVEVPYPRGSYLYYRRTEKAKSYAIHCRKRNSGAPEEILLDENVLAEGHQYFSLGNFEVSSNERLLAYSTDVEGDEVYVTRVRDLATGKNLSDEVTGTSYTLAWTNDNAAFYYVTLDDAKRPFRVWRHTLGAAQDELIFEEPDQRFEVELYKSRDDRYIFILTESKITSEAWFAPAASAASSFEIVWPRRHDVLYEVESHGDDFYVLTNDGAREFRILRCTAQDRAIGNAVEFLPARPNITIEGIDAFRDFLVVYERHQGLPQIRVHKLAANTAHYVTFDEPSFTLGSAPNEVFETNEVRFTYSSLVTPHSVFEYNVVSGEKSLLKQTPVPGYDPGNYISERIFATAGDGTKVPISLVYRSGFEADGTHPLLLYGYGSYGLRSDPAFRSDRLPLLDRGFAFAIAHIRGGGDLGRKWYESAKLLTKKTTFTDFIDCASYLIDRRYTSRDKLVIQGGSAGGMLIGGVLNLRPDLFHAAVAMVPFVDTLTTCLDPTLPLTIGEYEEWGNANDPEYYSYIKSYSPYDNTGPLPYPHLLITAGLNDPRVSYWEPAKWTAKLRRLKKGDSLLLLKTNMGAGHFGASGRYGRLKELAFIYAFILKSVEQ